MRCASPCRALPAGAKHREIRAVLERFAPVVQAASIDEWYLDLGGTEALYDHASLDTIAHRIRDAVLAGTGLSVSIGGGTSKLVAKLAVERAKPKTGATGVHVVPAGDELAFMRQLDARRHSGHRAEDHDPPGRARPAHGGGRAGARRGGARPARRAARRGMAGRAGARRRRGGSRGARRGEEHQPRRDLRHRHPRRPAAGGRADRAGGARRRGAAQRGADHAHDHRAHPRHGLHDETGQSHGGRGAVVRSCALRGGAHAAAEAAEGAARAGAPPRAWDWRTSRRRRRSSSRCSTWRRRRWRRRRTWRSRARWMPCARASGAKRSHPAGSARARSARRRRRASGRRGSRPAG